jgi:hypothetical protein
MNPMRKRFEPLGVALFAMVATFAAAHPFTPPPEQRAVAVSNRTIDNPPSITADVAIKVEPDVAASSSPPKPGGVSQHEQQDRSKASKSSTKHQARRQVCQPFVDAAVEVGWPTDLLNDLERIWWRESRCLAHVTGKNRNGTVDRGLMQVNSANRKFLQEQGVIDSVDDLYDPKVNLQAGFHLYRFWGSLCPWTPPRYCA